MAKRTRAVKRGAVVASRLTGIVFSFDFHVNPTGAEDVGIVLSDDPKIKGPRGEDLKRFLVYVAAEVASLVQEGLKEAAAPLTEEEKHRTVE